MAAVTSSQPADPFSQPPLDPLLADRMARLQQLKQSRAASAVPKAAPADPATGRREAAKPARRRHPAKKSRIAALALSFTTTGGLTALLSYVDHANATSTAAATQTVGTVSPTVAPTGTTGTTVAGTTGTTATSASTATSATKAAAGTSAGGTFSGQAFSNRYGDVQVQITVANGTITQSAALQSPANDRRSVSINNSAVPTLNAETTQAQSATIQAVSGATYTSNGYQQSLQSAIDQAVAAGALKA